MPEEVVNESPLNGPFRIGDRVRRIIEAISLPHQMREIPIGAIGTVTRPTDLQTTRVRFDDYPIFGFSDESYGSYNRCLELVLDQMRRPGEFRIGDRVRLTIGYQDGPHVGAEGVVRLLRQSHVKVEFDHAFPAGHGCQGVCRDGRGFNVPVSNIELFDNLDEAVSSAIKAFRIVRNVNGGFEDVAGEGFDTGREAADRARDLTQSTGVKHSPRRNALPDNWRDRETARFSDGTYQAMPEGWDLTPIPDHFLHLSNKRGLVAFTPNEVYGNADRQTAKRPGSYVATFYPNLTKHDQERYAALVSCEGRLQLGTTREDFKRVYREGPESCMSYEFNNLPCHPSEVYAAGDLSIAWIEDDEGQITSRCVVWPTKKLRTRCYGDVEKMRAVLGAAGYREGNFYGAKLLRVDTKEGDIVCPYVDECSSRQGDPDSVNIQVHSDHLVISDDYDEHEANATNGKIYYDGAPNPRLECNRCRDTTDEVDLERVRIDTHRLLRWCQYCRDDYSFYCDGLGENVCNIIPAYIGGGTRYPRYNMYSRIFVDNHSVFVSNFDNSVFPESERVVLDDGQEWSNSEFAEHGFTCAGSGNRYSREDPHETIDGLIYHEDHLPERGEGESSSEGLRAA